MGSPERGSDRDELAIQTEHGPDAQRAGDGSPAASPGAEQATQTPQASEGRARRAWRSEEESVAEGRILRPPTFQPVAKATERCLWTSVGFVSGLQCEDY